MSYYADDTVTVHHGDCLDVLATLPDASVDAVVTDPPYNLGFMGKTWDRVGGMARATSTSVEAASNPYGRARTEYGGASYGGSQVESMRAFQAWCQLWATECLRVLKPGGHLLAFGGTRTSHRLTSAIEDAGFEIRDSIAWLYGSGFPKSLDVSKAIDKVAHVNDETHRRIALVAEVVRTHREAKGMERAEVSLAVVGTPSGACWNWEHQQLPSVEMWPDIKAVLDIPDKYDGLIEGDRAQFIAAEREVLGARSVPLGHAFAGSTYGGDSSNILTDLTAPATDAARTWAGWGTALKPAHEPVVVARKPLSGTVAQTVLEHGTGALNVDGCRVGTGDNLGRPASDAGDRGSLMVHDGSHGKASGADSMFRFTPETQSHPAGRWPANVVLDESQAAALDQQSGEVGGNSTGPGGTARRAYTADRGVAILNSNDSTPFDYRDDGGASRFFYTAKADAAERVRIDGTAHPTVKPLALMRWLVRLVTPPGGIVLEPFAGSGTTVEACILEGFRCVAIEREADYLPLILQRVHRRRDPVAAVKATGVDGGLFDLLGEDDDEPAAGGRWPPNVVMDKSQAAELDKQSGERSSPASYVQQTREKGEVYGLGSLDDKAGKTSTHHGDTGGASRFFPVLDDDGEPA